MTLGRLNFFQARKLTTCLFFFALGCLFLASIAWAASIPDIQAKKADLQSTLIQKQLNLEEYAPGVCDDPSCPNLYAQLKDAIQALERLIENADRVIAEANKSITERDNMPPYEPQWTNEQINLLNDMIVHFDVVEDLREVREITNPALDNLRTDLRRLNDRIKTLETHQVMAREIMNNSVGSTDIAYYLGALGDRQASLQQELGILEQIASRARQAEASHVPSAPPSTAMPRSDNPDYEHLHQRVDKMAQSGKLPDHTVKAMHEAVVRLSEGQTNIAPVPGADCSVPRANGEGNITVPHGEGRWFSKHKDECFGSCFGDFRRCTDGILDGDRAYNVADCMQNTCIPGPNGSSCTTLDGAAKPHGWEGALFKTQEVFCERDCGNEGVVRPWTNAPEPSNIRCMDGHFRNCPTETGPCFEFSITVGGGHRPPCPGPVPPGGCPWVGGEPEVFANNAFGSCEQKPCRSCAMGDGAERPHGWSGAGYAENSVSCGACPAPTPCSCNDGNLSWGCEYATCSSMRPDCVWSYQGVESFSSAHVHLGAMHSICAGNDGPSGPCTPRGTTCGVMVNVDTFNGQTVYPWTCNENNQCWKDQEVYACE